MAPVSSDPAIAGLSHSMSDDTLGKQQDPSSRKRWGASSAHSPIAFIVAFSLGTRVEKYRSPMHPIKISSGFFLMTLAAILYTFTWE